MKLDNMFKKNRSTSLKRAESRLTKPEVPEGLMRKCNQCGKAIIAEEVVIDENTEIGVGEEAPSKLSKKIYASDIATIGEQTYIPKNVKVGKNTVIMGKTKPEDYPDGLLESGDYIIKAGEM